MNDHIFIHIYPILFTENRKYSKNSIIIVEEKVVRCRTT